MILLIYNILLSICVNCADKNNRKGLDAIFIFTSWTRVLVICPKVFTPDICGNSLARGYWRFLSWLIVRSAWGSPVLKAFTSSFQQEISWKSTLDLTHSPPRILQFWQNDQTLITSIVKEEIFCMLRNTRSELTRTHHSVNMTIFSFSYVSQSANKLKKYV